MPKGRGSNERRRNRRTAGRTQRKVNRDEELRFRLEIAPPPQPGAHTAAWARRRFEQIKRKFTSTRRRT